jgi:LysM repeat protein
MLSLTVWKLSTKKRCKSGLINEDSITYIVKSTRKSTEKAYGKVENTGKIGCSQQGSQIDPTAYNSTIALYFLVDNNKLNSTNLNTLRTSMSSAFRVTLSGGDPSSEPACYSRLCNKA